jgi:hypothetical protein
MPEQANVQAQEQHQSPKSQPDLSITKSPNHWKLLDITDRTRFPGLTPLQLQDIQGLSFMGGSEPNSYQNVSDPNNPEIVRFRSGAGESAKIIVFDLRHWEKDPKSGDTRIRFVRKGQLELEMELESKYFITEREKIRAEQHKVNLNESKLFELYESHYHNLGDRDKMIKFDDQLAAMKTSDLQNVYDQVKSWKPKTDEALALHKGFMEALKLTGRVD